MASETLANLRAALVIRELEKMGQGLRFDCPVCNCGCEDKRITVWFENPIGGGEPAYEVEGDLRTRRTGENIHELSLEGLMMGKCGHVFEVKAGVVSWYPA